MFWNIACPPAASTESFGLNPVAVTLIVISLFTAGESGAAGVPEVPPQAETASVRDEPIAARHNRTKP